MATARPTDLALDPSLADAFDREGFVAVEHLVPPEEVARLVSVYDKLLDGSVDCGQLRSDLGSDAPRRDPRVENITQVMWPSELLPELLESLYYRRALAVARTLLGDDMAPDFDMLIDKAPGTATPTPWHQDMAYWIDLPDRRAVSAWLALDEATVDNGCMWFVPRSHRAPLRKHRPVSPAGSALVCEASEAEAVAVPLRPGSCSFHHGGTVHYSRGNSTASHRRALIVNFRPAAMIALERARGFDHGKTENRRLLRNDGAR